MPWCYVQQIPDVEVRAHDRYLWVRLLWGKVIIRAMFDYVLWRDSKDIKLKRCSMEAEKWLFEPSLLHNSLVNICEFISADVEKIRRYARSMTKGDVKKMEHIERECRPLLGLPAADDKEGT